MTTYCIDSDVKVKLSNLNVASGILTENFRIGAYNRINAKLRKIYEVPVVSSDTTDTGLLQGIESNIAAGRLLLSISTINQMEGIQQYAVELLKQGEGELKELITGDIVLSIEAERRSTDTDDTVNMPYLTGQAPDEFSTFGRPLSGIENDALEGVVNSEQYDSLEDNKSI